MENQMESFILMASSVESTTETIDKCNRFTEFLNEQVFPEKLTKQSLLAGVPQVSILGPFSFISSDF